MNASKRLIEHEQQCLDCKLFNLLSRHTCEYCGSTNLKVVPCEIRDDQKGRATIVEMSVEKFIDTFGELGPAFLQCGRITGYLSDGVTLCGLPMYHEGKCR